MFRKFYYGFIFLFLMGAKPGWLSAESYSVAIVKSRNLEPYEQASQGIQQQLKAEGEEASFDFYDLEGDVEKGSEIARRIQEKKSRLVFTIGTEALQAVSGKLLSIPIVTAMLVDPVGEGIVVSDGENTYGAYLKVPYPQRFALLKKVTPELKTIAILYWEKHEARIFSEVLPAVQDTGIKVTPIKITSIQKFSAVLKEASERSQALMMTLDNELYNSVTSKELLLFSARNKYPLIAFSPNYVKSGALISFSADFWENGMSAGRLGVMLLRGKKPDDRFIPTEHTHVAWNRNVAKAFDIALGGQGAKEIEEYV